MRRLKTGDLVEPFPQKDVIIPSWFLSQKRILQEITTQLSAPPPWKVAGVRIIMGEEFISLCRKEENFSTLSKFIPEWNSIRFRRVGSCVSEKNKELLSRKEKSQK